jgi:hypothetical protein
MFRLGMINEIADHEQAGRARERDDGLGGTS